MIDPELEITEDGSFTLRHPVIGDTYHSTRGAVGEAMHVFIRNGFRHWLEENGTPQMTANTASATGMAGTGPGTGTSCPASQQDIAAYPKCNGITDRGINSITNPEHISGGNASAAANAAPLRIFEMGFGSGLNAWLTLQEASAAKIRVEYHTLELFPISEEAARRLNYSPDPLFMELHTAPWGSATPIGEYFIIKKNATSLLDYNFDTIFDIIYFDAFAPDTQPELWSEEVFRRLYDATAERGILVTYSSKGLVKRGLRAAGWNVSRIEGALGKRHMLRAVK